MSFYVINWHRKQGNLSFGTVLLALFFGIILSIIIYDSEKDERKRKREEKERESNDSHRKWFQTLGLINRERMSNVRNNIPPSNRTIPPPPPISRVEPPNRRPDNKLKDFKFFHK